MAMTLVEAAKYMDGEDLRQAVIQLYAASSMLLEALPFEDIEGNALRYNQEQALPGIGFRGVNEAFAESTGVINPVVEPLVIAGGDLDVDTFILRTQGMDKRAQQEAMKIKALAHKWTNTFFKGDSTSDPREFDGLQARLTGPQLIAAGATSGGDALSLAKLDEAIDAVDSPTHIAMNKVMARRFAAAARSVSVGGYITIEMNEFGKRVMSYNGLPFIIVGNNGDVYNTLDFTEANPGGGSSVGTSIYPLSLQEGMLNGIQSQMPMVRDLGELDDKPAMRSRVEWDCGITLYHPRAAARLYGVKNAAITA